MKSLFFAVILTVFYSDNVYAQSLSLDNLISIRTGSIDKINEILLPKGWLFTGNIIKRDEPLRECVVDELMWKFNASNYNDGASAFIVIERSYECSNTVSYQTMSVESFYQIHATIKKYAMKSSDTEMNTDKNGDTWATTSFVGNKYIVNMSVRSVKGENRNSYTVIVSLKD